MSGDIGGGVSLQPGGAVSGDIGGGVSLQPGAALPCLFDLSGQLAVVTGARRGIGLAIADALAGAGADIVAVSAHLDPDGGEVARRVRARGRECSLLHADLADRGRTGGTAC